MKDADNKKPTPGTKLGSWVLVAEIETGGMGEVWYAARWQGNRIQHVAIKLVRDYDPEDDMDLELTMFRDEASLLLSLEHPNIVRGIEYGADSPYGPFLVMEFLDGASIDALLSKAVEQGKSMPTRIAAYILLELVDALEYAHNAHDVTLSTDGTPGYTHLHLTHRDIKPGNVFLTRHGWIKLGDFGIAVFRNRATEETNNGMRWSVHFQPPRLAVLGAKLEAAKSMAVRRPIQKELNERTREPAHDIYLLGETAYRLLCRNRSPYEDLIARAQGKLLPLDSDVDPQLARLILQMLDDEPTRRPDTGTIRSRVRQIVPEAATGRPMLVQWVNDILGEEDATTLYSRPRIPAFAKAYLERRTAALRVLGPPPSAPTEKPAPTLHAFVDSSAVVAFPEVDKYDYLHSSGSDEDERGPSSEPHDSGLVAAPDVSEPRLQITSAKHHSEAVDDARTRRPARRAARSVAWSAGAASAALLTAAATYALTAREPRQPETEAKPAETEPIAARAELPPPPAASTPVADEASAPTTAVNSRPQHKPQKASTAPKKKAPKDRPVPLAPVANAVNPPKRKSARLCEVRFHDDVKFAETVWVDGRKATQTRAGVHKMRLSPGKYSVIFERPKNDKVRRTLEFSDRCPAPVILE